MTDPKSSYKAPAIEKAARLMELLAQAEEAQALSTLARALGVGKSSLLGVLRGLHDAGWVDRGKRGYVIGQAFLALARKVSPHTDLAEHVRPHLAALAEKLGQSVCLGRRTGFRIVIVACAEAAGNLRIALKPGMTIPLFAAATGMALLSLMEEEDARALLPEEMPTYTRRSPGTRDEFMEGVSVARRDGFALDDEEYLRGVRAAAAPLTFGGRTDLVLWTVGFTDSFPEEKMREAGAILSETAKSISLDFTSNT